MSSLNKARRIAAAGVLLYGDRWQRPLARAMGISQTAISQMLSGDRSVTDDVETTLAATLAIEAARLRTSAYKLDRLRQQIEDDEIG